MIIQDSSWESFRVWIYSVSLLHRRRMRQGMEVVREEVYHGASVL